MRSSVISINYVLNESPESSACLSGVVLSHSAAANRSVEGAISPGTARVWAVLQISLQHAAVNLHQTGVGSQLKICIDLNNNELLNTSNDSVILQHIF